MGINVIIDGVRIEKMMNGADIDIIASPKCKITPLLIEILLNRL